MLTTIAFITIFSSIIIFFSEELIKYAKALTARTYVFLVFGLLVLSACIEMYTPFMMWLVIKWWIGLLYAVQALSDYLLGSFAEQLLAKWLIVVVVSAIPVVVALRMDQQKRRHSLYNSDAIKKRGYGIGLMFWFSTVLLFVLGLPGSDFSG
jgi:hypothetical protein